MLGTIAVIIGIAYLCAGAIDIASRLMDLWS